MAETSTPTRPRGLVLGLGALAVVVVAGLAILPFLGDLERVEPIEAAGEEPVGVADDFDRPDGPGLATDDQTWSEPSGAWSVQDGHVALTGPAPEGRASLAVLETPGPDGVVSVTATAVEPGWGLAFRVGGVGDFAAVVARPETSSWSLVRVQAGSVTETTGILAVEPADGQRLEVRLAGADLAVTVAGATVQLPGALAGQERTAGVGPVAVTGRNAASMAWDDVAWSPR